MNTTTVPFDIYLPATAHREAIKVETIRIEVVIDDHGNEMVTPESTALIEKTQARYLGLLAAEDIRALREKLGCSQDRLSEALGCGKKSLSRWENGREYPSQLVNTLLRLLESDKVTLEDIREVRQPRLPVNDRIVHFIDSRREAPKTYKLGKMWKDASADEVEALVM